MQVFKRNFYTTIVSILLIFSNHFFCVAIDKAEFNNANHQLRLGKYFYIFEDRTGNASIEEVLSKNFIKNTSDVPNLGISSSAFWIRFQVLNNSNTAELLFELAYPMLDEVELYDITDRAKISLSGSMGDRKIFSERHFNHPNFLFPIQIPLKNSRTYLMKVRAGEQIMLPLDVGTYKEIFDSTITLDTAWGIYFGIILVMVFYNLFIFFSVKDKVYLLYVIYIILVGLTQGSLTGYTFKYLWPESPWLANQSAIFFPSAVGICLAVFLTTFINTSKHAPKIHTGFYVIIVLLTITIILGLTGQYNVGQMLVQLFAGIFSLYGLFAAVIISMKGDRPAKFFLLAWSIFLLGICIFVLKDFGILPYNGFTNYTMPLGSAIEVVMLSFALADRINTLKSEKEAAQKRELKERAEAETMELLNEQRTNTFINLTHETKTPLTLINNYLEEYIQKYGETEELRIIKTYTEKLTRDITNLFDLERFKKGTYSFDHSQICNLSSILRDHLALFKAYASRKKIEIVDTIEDNIYTQADPDAIHQLINNLIENAVKYTDKKGKIVVSLSAMHHTIRFIIKDNGIGIPPELKYKILEPYYQINREKRNYQGLGMGLAIVKQILDSLNGNIAIEKNDLEISGTEIIVDLKKHTLIGNEITASAYKNDKKEYLFQEELNEIAQLFDENKATILVVEDNIPLLNYMTKKLTTFYNVHMATCGLTALEKIKDLKHLDLIISDVMMDKMNGLDFYKAVAENEKVNHIPFIFITAKTSSEDKLQGLSLGAIDYIQKPFIIGELTAKIDAVLKNLKNQRVALINNAFRSLLTENRTQPLPVHLNKFSENCSRFNLTPREIDIIKLIGKGESYKGIANTLFISDKTVAKHVQNILKKVSVSNKIELLNRLGVDNFSLHQE
jgi:signal transduction histidine kinase/DNA-binding NarL/FixJ family response regulator